MKNTLLKKYPLWLPGAILYGCSWPMPWRINLSFLAWFALIFLFESIKKQNSFWRFWGTAWIFSFITHTICSGWFLDIPTNKLVIIIGALNESVSFTIAFIPLFFLQRKIGFDKAIYGLPFFFVLSEWLYSTLEHNLGYLMVVHSQTANPWLLQYVDLFGFLSVTFWVVSFNVLLYSALRRGDFQVYSRAFAKRAALIALIMLSLPLLYAWHRHQQIGQKNKETITISMVHTMFPPKQDDQQKLKNLDRLVELTDSLNYYAKKKSSDLYVWHEGAIPSGNTQEVVHYVQDAVVDWQVPLLSGMHYYLKFPGTDYWQAVNRVVLFPTSADSTTELPLYDKTNLAPGWESIPYLGLFHRLGIHFASEYKYKRRGDRVRLFTLPMDGRTVHIGTPICFEQNTPALWNQMVRLGAECFVVISYESWFGETYFQKQVGYISRLRAIETRRSIARCSNGGLTFFVDAFGRIYAPAPGRESVTTGPVRLSRSITFYTQYPNLFPLTCLIISVLYFLLAFLWPFPKAKNGDS